MLAFWRAGTALSLRHAGWQDRLEALLPEDLQEYLPDWIVRAEDASASPIARAISILTNIVQAFPRQEAMALLCADIVLARSLGWEQPLPLFGLLVTRKTLRAASEGEDIGLSCHNAIAGAAQDAVRMGHDLARRAASLRGVTPKLRSKGSDEAIALFLSEDAVLPSTMLSPTIRGSSTPMTARSARRLCERLIDQSHNFSEEEMGVLCAVAYHQPIDRAGLADIFGKEINRDLLGRLRYKGLIGNGPKSPRPGAPHTFVTTQEFLATFDLQSLRDLPDLEIDKP